jgi:hypothetical protein
VRNEAGGFYVIREDRPCFFAGGYVDHDVSIISKRNPPGRISMLMSGPGVEIIEQRAE